MKTYIYAKDDHGYPIKVEVNKPKTEPSESVIQDAVAKTFIKDGWEVVRYNSGTFETVRGGNKSWITCNRNVNSKATAGHPDLVAYKNMMAVRMEIKKPKLKRSQGQESYHANGLKHGNPIVVLRSISDATELINSIKLIGIIEAVSTFVKK